MPAFRIPYALAYGKYKNFEARTDNVFASLDATPDISLGSLFWTNNASATSVTYFDGATNGLINPEEGQTITVGVLDGNTTFVNSNQLRLTNGANITATAGSFWNFIYHNSSWYQVNPASLNTAGALAGAPAQTIVAQITSSDLGATGLYTVTPFTTAIGVLAAAASNFVIRGLPGGYTGQRINFINLGSSMNFVTNSAGATDSFVVRSAAGTTAIVTGTANVEFVRFVQGGTAKWFEVTSVTGG